MTISSRCHPDFGSALPLIHTQRSRAQQRRVRQLGTADDQPPYDRGIGEIGQFPPHGGRKKVKRFRYTSAKEHGFRIISKRDGLNQTAYVTAKSVPYLHGRRVALPCQSLQILPALSGCVLKERAAAFLLKVIRVKRKVAYFPGTSVMTVIQLTINNNAGAYSRTQSNAKEVPISLALTPMRHT